MDLTPDLIKDFAPEEQRFIETLFANGQLLITEDKNTPLPAGVTHIMIVKLGEKPKVIRKRFH